MNIKQAFKELNNLDWNNIEKVSFCTQKFLKKLISDVDFLKDLLKDLRDNKNLISLCEEYDFLGKIALYGYGSDKFRLRFHLFLPGYSNRPHYHRWCYSSLILSGEYQHFLYGTENEFKKYAHKKKIGPKILIPTMVRKEKAGSLYTLNHNIVHSVIAKPYTLSLFLRGPAVKDRFLLMDKRLKTVWWQYGSTSETAEEKEIKKMSLSTLETMTKKIIKILDYMEGTKQ